MPGTEEAERWQFQDSPDYSPSKILSHNNMRSRLKGSGPKALLAFQVGKNKLSQGCVDPETNQGLKGGKGGGG